MFGIIEELVLWKNTTNEEVLDRARAEMWQSWRRTCAENADHPRAAEIFDRDRLPAFHDPFAGGGALPLEAQRLGLETHASDLNPVAVLINKAMIEIPPRFAGRPPVNPKAHRNTDLIARGWKGARGLAEDVRYYGQWMRDEAEHRIGHLYPKVEVTPEMVKERPDLKAYEGRKLTVIAWLWARTVKSPNPACAVAIESAASAGLKPWREIVTPHKDVASGRYQQAEFAADLWQVHLGEGTDEYRDPVEFFRRTYLTESLKGLLVGAIHRLAGQGGDPVVQLQTNFGGGKTHSMLALYHLFSGTAPGELVGIDTVSRKRRQRSSGRHAGWCWSATRSRRGTR